MVNRTLFIYYTTSPLLYPACVYHLFIHVSLHWFGCWWWPRTCMKCFNGHVLCSSCRDKLEATGNGKCHVCREEIDSDDSRCYAMERVVESIRVPCPNAAHGCAARLTYYGRSSHRRVCPHTQYSCCGHGCGFVGPAGALLDHVASVHTNNNEGMQQFWMEELSSFMARMKLAMATVPPTSGHRARHDGGGVSVDKGCQGVKEIEWRWHHRHAAIMDLTNWQSDDTPVAVQTPCAFFIYYLLFETESSLHYYIFEKLTRGIIDWSHSRSLACAVS